MSAHTFTKTPGVGGKLYESGTWLAGLDKAVPSTVVDFLTSRHEIEVVIRYI